MKVATLDQFNSPKDPLNGFYTDSERNERKYDVAFAIEHATRRLSFDKRFDGQPINTSCLEKAGLNRKDKITLRAAHAIADQIVNDTCYGRGPYRSTFR